jgi:hypothetical protein
VSILRREGEAVRLRHTLARLRAHCDSIEIAMRLGGSIGGDTAQGIAQTGVEAAMLIAKHDAYELAARDAAPPSNSEETQP